MTVKFGRSVALLLGLGLGGCVDLDGLGKDDGDGGGEDGGGDAEELDCDALRGKQVELPDECKQFQPLSPSVQIVRRVPLGEGIGINDPGRTGGDGPIPWELLPQGTDFGPGLGAAGMAAEAAAIWDRDRLQPGEDDDSPSLRLQSPNEDGLGNALVGTFSEDGEVRMLVASTEAEYVERYVVTPESIPDAFSTGAAPPESTVEIESFAAADAAWTAPVGLELGAALAAGDFNGDGVPDVAMTAPGESIDGASGAVYVAFGPHPRVIDMPTEGLRLTGSGELPGAGELRSLGDLDGDGADELGLGSPTAAGGDGAFVLLTGLGSLTGPAELEAVGRVLPLRDGAGGAFAAAWDVDEDGVVDVALGAPGDSTEEPGAGAVYLLSGRALLDGVATLDDAALAVRLGESAGAALGTDLALAGDTDGDGKPELIVGAPFATDLEGLETGAVYLVQDFSSSGYVGLGGRGFSGSEAGVQLGFSVDGGVDVDGDGLSEFAAYEGATGDVLLVFGEAAAR